MAALLCDRCDNWEKGFESSKEFDMHLYTLSRRGDICTRKYKNFALEYLAAENDLQERTEDRQLSTRIATRVHRPKTPDKLRRN